MKDKIDYEDEIKLSPPLRPPPSLVKLFKDLSIHLKRAAQYRDKVIIVALNKRDSK